MNIVVKSLIQITLVMIGFFSMTGIPNSLMAKPVTIERVKIAVEKALDPIVKSATAYVEEKSCFTCHHQALPVMAASNAELIGIKADRHWLELQRKFTADFFLKRKADLAQGRGVPGGAFTAGYALAQFMSTSQLTEEEGNDESRRLEGTNELLEYLLEIYRPERPWKINTIRPPLESSDFTATGLAIAALGTFEREKLIERVNDIRKWYQKTKAVSAEDRAFQLMGWYWLINTQYYQQALREIPAWPDDNRKLLRARLRKQGEKRPNQQLGNQADLEQLQKMISTLKQLQLEDGGWGQTDTMQSDAYATGLIMTALLTVQPELIHEEWCSQGVDYLLEGQKKDGTWHVLTRSKPIQEYFESGFPYGEDQFISISASCWSVIALSKSIHARLHLRK